MARNMSIGDIGFYDFSGEVSREGNTQHGWVL
jgi:hypothetical protein